MEKRSLLMLGQKKRRSSFIERHSVFSIPSELTNGAGEL
jgi:hypothetical protein